MQQVDIYQDSESYLACKTLNLANVNIYIYIYIA